MAMPFKALYDTLPETTKTVLAPPGVERSGRPSVLPSQRLKAAPFDSRNLSVR